MRAATTTASTQKPPRATRGKKAPPFTQIVDYEGTPACARHGHTVVVDERGGGTLIIFGGSDDQGQFCTDLHFFILENRTWSVMSAKECPGFPKGRQFHTAVIHEDWMYIFGGNSNGYYNDLHRFHLDLCQWEEVISRSDPSQTPTPRAGHSAVVHDKHMYVFAGYDKYGMTCNDLYQFNFDTWTWKKLVTSGVVPNDVFHHTAIVYQGSMYIFGGRDAHVVQPARSDQPSSSSSFPASSFPSISTASSTSTTTSSSSLAALTAASTHAAVTAPSVAATSSLLISSAAGPFHSSSSSSSSDASNGAGGTKWRGLLEYRFRTGQWSRVVDRGAPPQRWGQKSVVYDGILYLFGGRDSIGNTDEMYEFNFATQVWKNTERGSDGMGISPRSFCAIGLFDHHLYVFGGSNIYNFCFNDLHVCDLVNKGTPCTLKNDLQSLLNDPELSDVTFRFPEENKFIFAHKNILSIRCAPFSAMFQSGMKEGNTGEIVITAFTHDSFHSFLNYLYTDKLVVKPKDLTLVLQIADLYQLDHLKSICEKRMECYIDLDNVLYLFQVADKFKAPQLKRACLKVIVKNFDNLYTSDQYQMLEPDLNSEIMRACTS